MSDRVLTDWDAEKAGGFGREQIVAHHVLHEREMFSDEGLSNLLDRYPREKLGVYTMGDDPVNYRTFRKGHAGNVPGAELLEAAKTGRFWLNLRATNHELEDYAALSDGLFGALEDGTPGLKTSSGMSAS